MTATPEPSPAIAMATQQSSAPRRSVVVAAGRSRIETFTPAAPGPNQVLVRVLANGLCASDLAVWADGPGQGRPLSLGHEPVGRVVAIGDGVTTPAIGDLVTGRLACSLADLVIAAAEDTVVVPSGVPAEAAIGEPLGCVVEALRRARVEVGGRIAVVGLGFMGLCLLQILSASPVGQIVAVDSREEARAHAMAHGADIALAPADVLGRPGMADDFDVVFEAAGVQPALDLATQLIRQHGTVSLVGYHQGRRTVDMQAWNWKAINAVSGHVRDPRSLADSTRRGLDAIASGRINYGALITHRYALSDVDVAFADLRRKPPGFIKAVITVDDGDTP